MRNTFLIISLIAVSITFAVIGCTSNASDKNNKSTKIDTVQQIVKGEYLVTIAGCDDCHSPKRMGAHGPEIVPELRFSGYPSSRPFQKPDSNAIKQGWVLMGADLTSAVGPWGMSFAANISSDNTGIGAWKEGQFITALRKGKFKGLETGRNLLPPMPWYNYHTMKDEDIKAIFAFLKSTKPVNNVVPAPKELSAFR